MKNNLLDYCNGCPAQENTYEDFHQIFKMLIDFKIIFSMLKPVVQIAKIIQLMSINLSS